MSARTSIEWTRGDDGSPGSTWNVLLGCDKVSSGCDHCYAIRTATRMTANPNPKVSGPYEGTVAGGEWTGRVNMIEDRLHLPLRWRRPRKIFVNAQSDLFHKDVTDEFIARVFAMAALTPRHTYQILTKRPGRMRSLMASDEFQSLVEKEALPYDKSPLGPRVISWPLRNVWLGVSVEDQKTADLRIPTLLDTPATVRWLSCEPLLGPVDLSLCRKHREGSVHDNGPGECPDCDPLGMAGRRFASLGWVVVGGESGPGARPMHPDWARTLRYQCQAAGVPFLFKQWGEWVEDANGVSILHADGEVTDRRIPLPAGAVRVSRIGKHKAGRDLDGRTWDEYPEVTP